MVGKEIINILLQEARTDLDVVEDALLVFHARDIGICSDKFITLMGYRKELADDIRKLEESIRRLDILEEVFKK